MSPQTHGLGRGLGALIPPTAAVTAESSDSAHASSSVLEVPVAEIMPNPRQPRTAMPPEALSELADSIREHGVIQPIIVTRTRIHDREYAGTVHRNDTGTSHRNDTGTSRRNDTGTSQAVGVLSPQGVHVAFISDPPSNLPVGTLQIFLDALGERGGFSKIDYVHGADIAARLGSQPGNAGFYLPAISKGDFFKTVILDGALPRKTFSMGEAREKRFYMEARRIT